MATSTITYGSATLTSVSADLTAVLAAGDAVQLVGGGGDVRNYTVASVPSSSTVTLTEIIGMETATTVPLRHNRQSIKVREVVMYLDTCECVFVFLTLVILFLTVVVLVRFGGIADGAQRHGDTDDRWHHRHHDRVPSGWDVSDGAAGTAFVLRIRMKQCWDRSWASYSPQHPLFFLFWLFLLSVE